MVRTGLLLLNYDTPQSSAFRESPIWSLYRDPDQLLELEALGASKDWIEKNVIDKLEDGDIWYASVGPQALLPSEMVKVSARIFLGTTVEIDGSLTLVDGEITSARCLTTEVLSEAEVLDEDNAESLRLIGKTHNVPPTSLLPLRYETVPSDRTQSLVPQRGQLDIPVCWAVNGN